MGVVVSTVDKAEPYSWWTSADAPGLDPGCLSCFPMIVTLDAAALVRCSLDINLLVLLHQIPVVLSLLPFPFLILKGWNIGIPSPRVVPRSLAAASTARDRLTPGMRLACLREMLSPGSGIFSRFIQCSPSPLQSAFLSRFARVVGWVFFLCK